MRLLLLLACALALPCQAQQRVRSLDEIPAALATPEGREVWATQMAGRPAPDRLGTRLPDGLDRATLLQALWPGVDPARAQLVGARAWAQHPGHAVAIACIGDEPVPAQAEPECDAWSTRAALAVLRIDAGPPRVVARLALDGSAGWPPLDWEGDAPQSVGDEPGALPQRWDRFDLAPYRLGDGPPAFGLRGSWSEGYSGGGASYSALYLFELRGDALAPVFAAPMSLYRDIAGDWNEDGTRQHDIEDWARVLVVEPARHDGRHDLRLRERGTRSGGQRWRWSSADGRYRRLPPP